MLQNVAVVILDGFTPFELGVLCEVFGVDRTDDGLPAYDFAVVAGEPGPLGSAAGFSVSTPYDLDRLQEADLVAVAAVCDDQLEAYTSGQFPAPLIGALRATVERGARVLSVCNGAFLLGAAGLLDGRRCTTHWRHAPDLARLHPAAIVQPRGAVRRRGPGDHQCGHRGGHRRVPARGAQGAGQPGGQRDRPPDGRPAAPRRRPGPVRGPAGRRARLRHAGRGHQLDAAPPR